MERNYKTEKRERERKNEKIKQRKREEENDIRILVCHPPTRIGRPYRENVAADFSIHNAAPPCQFAARLLGGGGAIGGPWSS